MATSHAASSLAGRDDLAVAADMNRSALSSEYFDVVKTTIRRLRSSPLAEAAFRAIWLLGFIFIARGRQLATEREAEQNKLIVSLQ
jgi:hypothetical protein